MASQTQTSTAVSNDSLPGNWKAGVIGGLAGGLLFGAMMAMMTPGVLEGAIPALYGIGPGSGAIGFAIHMSHGAVLGVVFAALIGFAGLERAPAVKQVSTGIVYGLVAWAVLAVVVMPIWLQAVGFPPAPDVPNIAMESLIGHTVYGAALGAVYYSLEEL